MSKRFSSSKIKNTDTLVAIFTGALILALMIFVAFQTNALYKNLNEKSSDRLAVSLATTIGESVGKITFAGQYQTRLLIEDLSKESNDVATISVENLDKIIVANSNPSLNGTSLSDVAWEENQKCISRNKPLSIKKTDAGKTFKIVIVPFRGGLNNEILGVVRLVFDETILNNTQEVAFNQIIKEIVLITFLLIFAVYLISRYFGKKVRYLANHLEGILSNSPVGILTFDKSGNITISSKTMQEFFINSDSASITSELTGNNFDVNSNNQIQEVFTAGDKLNKLEFEISVTNNGVKRFWQINKFRISDNNVNKSLFCIFVSDITERREAENSLQQSEKRFRMLFEAMPFPVVVASTSDEKYIIVNDTYCQLIGMAKSEIIGKSVAGMGIDIETSRRHRAELLKTGRLDGVTIEMPKADGTSLWFQYSAFLTEMDGEQVAISGLIDISGLKKAEKELAESEARLREIGNNLPTGMIYQLVQPKVGARHFTYVSNGSRELHGYEPEEVLENIMLVYSQFHPDDIDKLMAAENITLENLSVFDEEARVIMPNGEVRRRRFVSSPRLLNSGDIVVDGIEMDITERKLAEDALRISENKLRSLFAAMQDVVVVLDSQGRYIEIAPTSTQLHYMPSDQLLGKTLTEALPEELSVSLLNSIQDVLAHGSRISQDYKMEIAGRTVWFSASISPYTSESVLWGARDITERKRAEESLIKTNHQIEQQYEEYMQLNEVLRLTNFDLEIAKNKAEESELKFREMANLLPQIIFETDISNRLTFVNIQAYNMMGYPDDYPIIGSNALDFYIPADRERAMDNIQRKLSGQTEGLNEYNLLRYDGTKLPVLVFSTPIIKEGKPIGLRGVILDITERLKAEEELRSTFAILSSFIKNSPIYTYLKEVENDKSIIRFVSDNFVDMVGFNTDNVIGKTMFDIFPPEFADKVNKVDIAVVNTGESLILDEELNGKYYITYNFPILNSDKKYLAGYSIDITDRKKATEEKLKLTEQLHQSQKMDAIGQLAGGISHDFNNLLGGIIGFAEVLRITDNLSETQNKYLSKIIESAERAGNLTKKLLTFSRRGAKANTNVDVAKIVADTIEILERTIDKNIEISFENKAGISCVVGDDALIQNAFLNISINAAHAMPHGGKLSFSIENISLDKNYCEYSPFNIVPGEYVEISIRDTGEGMSPEISSRIFEPFFTTKEQGKGTGLGLSMVYVAVQEHSGAITVYSEIGNGSVFHIYLPLSSNSKKIEESNETLAIGSGAILIVDDEEVIRITTKSLLESLGYVVFEAENGVQAIDIFQANVDKIDLIILDMIMPLMGGREAFGKLRAIKSDIPIIIASGFAKDEDMTLLKDQGLSGFLQKPFRLAALSEEIKNALIKKP